LFDAIVHYKAPTVEITSINHLKSQQIFLQISIRTVNIPGTLGGRRWAIFNQHKRNQYQTPSKSQLLHNLKIIYYTIKYGTVRRY